MWWHEIEIQSNMELCCYLLEALQHHTHKLINQDTLAGVKGNEIPQNRYLLAHDARDTDLGGQPKHNLEKAPNGISNNGPTATIRVTSRSRLRSCLPR